MKITGLKRDHLLNSEWKASRSKFVGTTGHDDQKRDNLVINGSSGIIHYYIIIIKLARNVIDKRCIFIQSTARSVDKATDDLDKSVQRATTTLVQSDLVNLDL